MAAGKIPWPVVARHLDRVQDASVLVGAGVGLDFAAIEMGDDVLVTATDPVTFATDEIGRYAVIVNANDVACSGAAPQWFQVVVLMPDDWDEFGRRKDRGVAGDGLADVAGEAADNGTDDGPASDLDASFGRIMSQIRNELTGLGATLIGGHSEVTKGLEQPIVVGQMMGRTTKEQLVLPSAQVGDALLMAGGVAVEATALMAREMPDRLMNAGMDRHALNAAVEYLTDPGLSVVHAARSAAATRAVSAMHDVTEGGVAQAARELAEACLVGVELEWHRLPLSDLTLRVCQAAGVDPLGSIGSGGLLLTCPQGHANLIVRAVQLAGSDCRVVGHVVEDGAWMVKDGQRLHLPLFEVDEVARCLGAQG